MIDYPLYRGISNNHYSPDLQRHFITQRVPTNISYLVDNIWEWLRPDDMPSRRTAVFACPQVFLAEQYATDSTLICTIEFKGRVMVAQLTDHEDAKLHPDVKALPKLVLSILGQEWIDYDAQLKSDLGVSQLFIPAMRKAEIDKFLSYEHNGKLREAIKKKSTFWADVKRVEVGDELSDGEVFFHATDGYYMKKLPMVEFTSNKEQLRRLKTT
jgi:hypothetical protein